MAPSISAPTEAEIRTVLAAIPAPDGGGDIVGRGMVSGLVVRDGHVGFAIEVEVTAAVD